MTRWVPWASKLSVPLAGNHPLRPMPLMRAPLLVCQVVSDLAHVEATLNASNKGQCTSPIVIQYPGASFNSGSVEMYYDAIDKLLDYWPGIRGEDSPKIGEEGSQAPGFETVTVATSLVQSCLDITRCPSIRSKRDSRW